MEEEAEARLDRLRDETRRAMRNLFADMRSMANTPLTEADIASLSDADLDTHLWLRLVARFDPSTLEDLLGAPAGVRAYFVTRLFEGEVDNGGLHQYFFNYPSPDLLALVLEGYSYLGLDDARRVVEEVAAPVAAAERAWRESLRDGRAETFFASYAESQLPTYDERIVSHDDERLRYVRANPELFVG